MSSKPSRLLDWCNDDDSGKFTVPDAPTQLAGHINDTYADDKLFNWTWWRISQWIEYIDELNLDQIPDGSSYAKVSVNDLTSNRVDFDKLDGVTTTKTEVNQLSGVDVGGNLTGDILTTDDIQTVTNKTLNSPKINEDVILSATSTELNILDGALLSTAELNTLNGITSTTAELNQLDGVEVGGSASGDIITTDDVQNMYSKTLTSSALGANVKRCVLSSELTAYDDRGDATIEPLIEMFSGGYILDLGNELNNPAQNTWSGLRIYAGNTAINAFNFNTSTGNGINIGSKVGRVVHAQSVDNAAYYGVYTTGAFTKGFMRGAVESGGAPTHSADSGTFWLSSAVDLYINTDGSTTWEMFIRNLGDLGITATSAEINSVCDNGLYNSKGIILGDSTAGRVIRFIAVDIVDGTNANTIKVRTIDRGNGDVIAYTDNIGKSSTVGDFSLDATGSILTVRNSGLTGDFVSGLAGDVQYNVATVYAADVLQDANGIKIVFTENSVSVPDLTSIVDSTAIAVSVLYITSA